MYRLRLHHIFVILSAFLLPGCISQYEPFVMILDKSYRLELIATNNDGFSLPDGMIVLPDRSLLVADEGGSKVLRWSSGQVEILCDSTSGIISPEDLVMDEEGDVYFTDDSAGGLWRLDREGRVHLVAGKEAGLISTEGIAIAPDGSILVGDGKVHEIFRVDREGEVTRFLEPRHNIEKPEALAFDAKGDLYISDDTDGVVYRLDTAHSLERLLDSGDGVGAPESIALRENEILITDIESGKIQRYELETGKLGTIAIFLGRLKGVQGIASAANGDIYVSVQNWDSRAGYIFRLEKLR